MAEYLKIFEVIVSLLLILIILIQNKSVTLNLTSMSGGMNQVKKRGPEKVLHIATIVIGVIFVLNSIILFMVG
ncbi:MAG: preprotein translocase subunit SecG [Candidatus Gracilibacteria bacterium]|nr:preprotein translocase subunit SecG [Candidatus Gracilibacteria bacterium]